MNKRLVLGGAGVTAVAAILFVALGSGGDGARVGTRAAAPSASSPAALAPGVLSLAVADSGLATFLIDAPLEKIKGRSTVLRGMLNVDPEDLSRTSGEVLVDLAGLVTETFGVPAKDASQTAHALNWFEIGPDVAAEAREANRWARLSVRGLELTGPRKLAEVPETNGARTVEATVRGDLWIHGVTAPKTVRVTATFTGAGSALRVRVVTANPLRVSLGEHDVKPRDVAGKFLSGALERIGQKIDDQVQVSVDLIAAAKAP